MVVMVGVHGVAVGDEIMELVMDVLLSVAMCCGSGWWRAIRAAAVSALVELVRDPRRAQLEPTPLGKTRAWQ